MQSCSTSGATGAALSKMTVVEAFAGGADVAGEATRSNTVSNVVIMSGFLFGECRMTIGEPCRTARIKFDYARRWRV
jgi:hypothetical protein